MSTVDNIRRSELGMALDYLLGVERRKALRGIGIHVAPDATTFRVTFEVDNHVYDELRDHLAGWRDEPTEPGTPSAIRRAQEEQIDDD